MADDNHKPSGHKARGSRRRPPTIDLTATEIVPPEPPKPSEPPEPAPDPAPVEASAPQAAAPAPEPEPAAAPTDKPSSEPPELKITGEPPPPPAATSWPMLGAAAGGGAAIMAVILLLLWSIPPGNGNVAQQTARIEKLEASLRELAARQMPPAADPQAVASVSDRVAKLEAAANAPTTPPVPATDPALAERLAAAERRIAALADENAALKRRSEANEAAAQAAQSRADTAAARAETAQAAGTQGTAAERQEIAALTERLATLERTAQALQADLARQRTNLAEQRETRADERAVRLAVVAEMLKAAVARGERFRTELDAAKALAPDQAALAPLAAFADSGVPTAAALAQRLRDVVPAMRRAAEPQAAEDGGFLKRLQVNAEKLVRIQPAGERAGDDAGAILARAETKAGRGDIAGALAELAALPPAVQAPAQDWIEAAQAREAAIDASRKFAAAHVGALARTAD